MYAIRSYYDRACAHEELQEMAHKLNIPVATTFLGKGAMPALDPLCMGSLGFMVNDYSNRNNFV